MSQPIEADNRGKIDFIGRKQELHLIQELIENKNEWGVSRFLLISGERGNGKSRLLHEIYRRYENTDQVKFLDILDFDDPVLHLADTIKIKIAKELDLVQFQSYFQKYSEYLKIQKNGLSYYQLNHFKKEIEKEFIENFNILSHNHRIILVFDTTDTLKERRKALEDFLKISIRFRNTLIIIAGRDAFSFKSLLKVNIKNKLIKEIELPVFTNQMSQEYLRKKQQILPIPLLNHDLAKKLAFLSGGKPILLDLAVYWQMQGIELPGMCKYSYEGLYNFSKDEQDQLRQDFEKKLVDPIIETTDKLHWFLILAAWMYPLDSVILSSILEDMSIKNAEEILEEAQKYIFVKRLPENRFKLHDEMRRMIQAHVLPQVDPDKERRIWYSKKASKFYRKIITQLSNEIISLEKQAEKKKLIAIKQLDLIAKSEIKRQQLWVNREQLLKYTLNFNINEGINIFVRIYENASTDEKIILRLRFIQLVEQKRYLMSEGQASLLDYYTADQLFTQGDYASARTIIEKLLERDILPLELKINSIKLNGNIRIRQGKVDAAIVDFKDAVNLSKDYNHSELLIKSTNALGWAFRVRGDLEQALKHYQEARWLFHNTDKQKQEKLKNDFGLILNNMAVILSRNNETRNTAIIMANTAIIHWENISDQIGLGKGYLVQGICYHRTDHSKRALNAFQKALEIFKPLGLKDEIAPILSWRGIHYYNIGKIKEAEKDLRFSLKIGPQHFRAMTANRLGRIYIFHQNWGKAQKHLEESLNLGKKNPDFKYWLFSISYLIHIAVKKNEADRLDEFIKQLEECLSKVENPDKNAEGIAYLGLAKLAFIQNSHEKIPLIVKFLEKGIPCIVLHGSWSRKDIKVQLSDVEQEFKMIDEIIVQKVGRLMIDFIYEKEKEDNNFSTALEIMFKWANWKRNHFMTISNLNTDNYITWLHLSDLHYNEKKSGWDFENLLHNLTLDLQELERESELSPDFIVFTGDLAYGQMDDKECSLENQYKGVNTFLDTIRTCFKSAIPKSKIFLVPGNHDVNRRKVSKATLTYLEKYVTENEVTDMIQEVNQDWIDSIKRLDDYKNFLELYGYRHLLQDKKRLIYSIKLDLKGVCIGIGGFNTCWSSTKEKEKGRLWMGGKWQLSKIRSELRDTDFRIVLLHHPPNWLVENEDKKFEIDLFENFTFCLHGHEHHGWVQQPSNNDHAVISSGACYQSSQEKNGYNIVRLNLDKKEGEVWLRTYNDEGAGGWIPKIIRNKTNNLGVWPLKNMAWMKNTQSLNN